MFFEDIIFVNDYEVAFDGTHHEMKRLQFNADVPSKYPAIVSNMAIIWPEIFKVVAAIESNTHLIIPKKQFHKNLFEVTWDQPITGTTIFNLCAYHMIKIVESENDKYVVAIDSNLIDGIPQAYAYVAEFIKALQEYNGKKTPFTAIMASMGNMYGGITKSIDRPIAGAAKHESTVAINVSADNHPYTEAYEKAERERKEVEAKRKAEEKAGSKRSSFLKIAEKEFPMPVEPKKPN